MMTNVADPIFVDTNIIVYASWSAAPLHQQARQTLAQAAAAGAPLVISRQVIRVFLATLNRPRSGLALPDLIAEVQAFDRNFLIADETAATTAALLALLPQASGMQVHDVNIVATMQVMGIQRLLTNNPNDFTVFEHMITIMPLVVLPTTPEA
jgi:predicted nucleic acid-binding protein